MFFMMLCWLVLYRVFCLCICRTRPDVSVVLCSVFDSVLLSGLLCVALFCVIMVCDVLFARV